MEGIESNNNDDWGGGAGGGGSVEHNVNVEAPENMEDDGDFANDGQKTDTSGAKVSALATQVKSNQPEPKGSIPEGGESGVPQPKSPENQNPKASHPAPPIAAPQPSKRRRRGERLSTLQALITESKGFGTWPTSTVKLSRPGF